MEGDIGKELDSNQEPGNQQMRPEPHMCSASSISEIQGIWQKEKGKKISSKIFFIEKSKQNITPGMTIAPLPWEYLN